MLRVCTFLDLPLFTDPAKFMCQSCSILYQHIRIIHGHCVSLVADDDERRDRLLYDDCYCKKDRRKWPGNSLPASKRLMTRQCEICRYALTMPSL